MRGAASWKGATAQPSGSGSPASVSGSTTGPDVSAAWHECCPSERALPGMSLRMMSQCSRSLRVTSASCASVLCLGCCTVLASKSSLPSAAASKGCNGSTAGGGLPSATLCCCGLLSVWLAVMLCAAVSPLDAPPDHMIYPPASCVCCFASLVRSCAHQL